MRLKTYSNIYPRIYDFQALYLAYRRARRGKRDRAEVMRFERNLEGELLSLQDDLVRERYRTGSYRTFHVYEPKERMVAALPFRDRVLQHSLVAAIEPIWEARFHHHSYACRAGRGMHSGADQAQQWLREVQRAHGRVYVFKADVRKYFPSINHEILMGLLSRRIACRQTLGLCNAIMSTWPQGLPIGNLTSQLWANVYLHELDEHVKQRLGVKRYARYMDDFIIVDHDKARLHALRADIEEWLTNALDLTLNSKTQVYPVSERRGRALDFLGYRMWTTHRRLRKDSVKRMQRNLQRMQRDYSEGRVGLKQIAMRINSWIGHAQHADSYRIRSRLLGNAIFSRGHTCDRKAA